MQTRWERMDCVAAILARASAYLIAVRANPCECENESHFAEHPLDLPTSHLYRDADADLIAHTPFGRFRICLRCATECASAERTVWFTAPGNPDAAEPQPAPDPTSPVEQSVPAEGR